MPRGNNRKPSELFDLKNLEQAKSLIQQINDILSKPFADSLSSPKAIEQQIKNTKKLKNLYGDLRKLSGNTLKEISIGSDAQNKELREMTKQLQQQIDLKQKQLKMRAEEESYIESIKEKEREANQQQKNKEKILSSQNKLLAEMSKIEQKQYEKQKKALEQEYEQLSIRKKLKAGAKDDYVEKRLNTYKNVYSQKTGALYDERIKEAIDNGETFTKSDVSNIMNEVANELNDPESSNAFSEGTKNLNESSKLLKLGSTAMKIAGDTIKSGWNIITSEFKNGMKEQVSLYNRTFESIATMNQTSSSEYRSRQIQTASDLSNRGLFDNVKVSEVQNMWASMAASGASESVMYERGLENVITKHIVPYLDTSSTSMIALNERLDGNFVKQVRGINKANQDIAQNNYITGELLNQIISNMEPMTDEAIKNLAEGSEEMTTFMNYAMSDEGLGLTEGQAEQVWSDIFRLQNYSGQMINGNTLEKTFALGAIQKGIDWNDPKNLNNLGALYLENVNTLGNNMLAGVDTPDKALITSLAGEAIGMNNNLIWTNEKINANGGVSKINEMLTKSEEADNEEYDNQAYESFKNGDYQTAEQKQQTWMDNQATGLATVNENLGLIYDAIADGTKSLIDTIKTLIGTQLIGKILGSGGIQRYIG